MCTPLKACRGAAAGLVLLAGCGGGSDAADDPGSSFEFRPYLTVDASGPDGSSVRAVALAGDELITLSDRVERWSLDTGERLGGGDVPAGFDGGERLHVSPTLGYLGFSDGGRFHRGVLAQDPLIEAKGSGYMTVSWIEGLDRFAATDGETIQFFGRADGALASTQPVAQGASHVTGGRRSYASVTRDHRIVIWPIDETQKGLVLAGHGAPVISVAYAPDEEHLASADSDGSVIVWSLEDGTERRRFEVAVGQTLPRVLIAFIGGSEVIALHGNGRDVSRQVSLRSVSTGETLRTLRSGASGIISLAVSTDGRSLAVGTAFSGRYSQNRVRDERTPSKRAGLLTSGAAHVFDVSDVGL